MHYDVTNCVLSNNVEYLEKEGSYKNSTKEVMYIVILSDLFNAIKKVRPNFVA